MIPHPKEGELCDFTRQIATPPHPVVMKSSLRSLWRVFSAFVAHIIGRNVPSRKLYYIVLYCTVYSMKLLEWWEETCHSCHSLIWNRLCPNATMCGLTEEWTAWTNWWSCGGYVPCGGQLTPSVARLILLAFFLQCHTCLVVIIVFLDWLGNVVGAAGCWTWISKVAWVLPRFDICFCCYSYR